MSDVIENVTDEERTAADAAEQAAFDGVFSGDSISNEEEESSEDTQEDDQTQSEQQTAETPPETKIAGMTETQIAELLKHASRIPDLEKQLRDSNGRYGGLKQSFEDLQKSKSNGLAGKITADKFKRMSEQFPEIAEMLAEDLSGMIDGAPSAAVTQEEINRQISTGISAFKSEFEKAQEAKELAKAQNRLMQKHPDFFTTTRESPQFKEWFAKLPYASAKQLEESNDPDYVASRVDEFKQSLAPENSKQQQQQQQQRRIDRAIQPEGSKAPPRRNAELSEQEAFDAVFKNRKKR